MTAPAGTRRERRAALREDARTQRGHPTHLKHGPWRSPFVLATLGALGLGVILIAAVALTSGATPRGAAIRPVDVSPPAAALIHGRAVGDPNAPITIEVWSDFQCPICQRFATTIEPLLRTTYVADGRVRLVYRDMAFLGQESVDAAAAARIADEEGSDFWVFHDLLFANQGEENSGAFSADRLADIAVAAGLDRATFASALAARTDATAVIQETQVGKAAGVQSTPTLIINGKAYAGLPLWTSLTQLLDSLAPVGSPAPSAPR